MKKIISCFIFIPILALSVTLDERRKRILSIIDQELDEVQRISRQKKERDPNLLLRMAELNLEKARLWRDKENKEYLSIPTRKRIKVNKRNYFKMSSKYFLAANKLCLKIIRNFKGYSSLGDVYYILGFNAKESNKTKLATKYLRLANKKTRKNSESKVKSQISLAELYYNQRKYNSAIPLYERALNRYKDKWYTKDSFNLAWCYYRVGRTTNAINKMKQVHKLSANKKYIDMSEDVERDIGLMYATSGRITKGINFYKKLNINFSDKLLRIGVNLVSQAKYTDAEKVFNYALSYEKKNSRKVDINIEQLNLYGKYAKYKKHLKTSKDVFAIHKKEKISREQLNSFEFQLKKVSAILQRQVVGKTYKNISKTRRLKAKQANAYFDMLAELKPNRSDEYYFLQGETALAAKLNDTAFTNYKKAFKAGIKLGKKRFRKGSMEGLLAVISKNKGRNIKNNIYTFKSFLKYFPSDKRRKSIYERLFKNYLDNNQYKEAKDVLDRYADENPKDYKLQEAMISNLMEVDRKKNDTEAIRNWVAAIDKNEYKVSSKYYLKLQELLTSLQIQKVQGQLSKGDKKAALIGYHNVLKDPYATKRSKINATYNLAALYFELGDTARAFTWSQRSLNEMGANDVFKFSNSFITIANFMFLQLEFKKTQKLYNLYLNKICLKKTVKKSVVFKNLFFIQLATHDTAAAEKTLSLGMKCRVKRSVLNNARFELMKEYLSEKSWSRYEKYVNSLLSSSFYYPKLVEDLIILEDLFKKYNVKAKENKYAKLKEDLYYRAKKEKRTLSLRVLNHFAEKRIKEMKKIVSRINLIELSFPEDNFNNQLKSKLALLEDLTKSAQRVHETGSGKGIIQSYKILFESHLKFSDEIRDFSPKAKSKDYVKSFKKSMADLTGQVKRAGINYKNEAVRTLKKNKILDKSNFLFLDSHKTKVPVEYFGFSTPYLMERGGKR